MDTPIAMGASVKARLLKRLWCPENGCGCLGSLYGCFEMAKLVLGLHHGCFG